MSRRCVVACLVAGALAIASLSFAESPLAEVSYFGSSVEFAPRTWGQGFLLTVSTPDGSVVQKTVKDGVPSFDLSELEGAVVDGRYKYDLVPIVALPRQRDVAPDKAGPEPRINASSLSGSFLVAGGSIVPPGGAEEPAATAGGPDAPADVVVSDDLIVDGNLCAGYSCVDGETFTVDTVLKLRDVNNGIRFDDTSVSPYPVNDWHIRMNDTTSGGASYMQFWDVTANQAPFTIEAGAANNVLVIDSNERVGINTSAPAGELHVRAASSPEIIMEQTSGTPYRWHMYANNYYWYLRDYTGGTYPIIVENDDSGPMYPMVIKGDGKVGWGTFSPTHEFELYRSGKNASIVTTRSGGAQNYINATASFGNFGTVSNHPLRLAVNSTWQMRIDNNSAISMANGAALTAGGVWTDASSRALKKDIENLSVEEAAVALTGLAPVKFAYKSNGERHVGFIAEDVPELVAGADRAGLSPMDVVAVLTRVVQQQEEIIEAQQRKLQEQAGINEQHQVTFSSILARISTLESK